MVQLSQWIPMKAPPGVNVYHSLLYAHVPIYSHIITYHLLSVYAHPDCRTGAAGAHSQPQSLARAWTGVAPPQGCLLKARFTTMMRFPDQTGAWNSDRNRLTANKLLLNSKKIYPFLGQLCCCGGRDHTWLQPDSVTFCCPGDAKTVSSKWK